MVDTSVLPTAVELARAGFDAVQRDPDGAARDLDLVLSSASVPHEAISLALWGRGRLRHNTGDYQHAVEDFERAIALALDHGDAARAAEIRISAAATFQSCGDVTRALHELDLAEPIVRSQVRGRLSGQRALVLLNLGRPLDALPDFDRAITALEGSDDLAGLARTHVNRAVAHMQVRSMRHARADLLRAHELATAAGEHLVAAGALHNLGCVAGRVGDHPAALRAFEAARSSYLHLGNPGRLLAVLDIDHCEVLLEVGLAGEALAIADRLVEELRSTGDRLQLGEAHLVRTRALHLLAEHERAVEEAQIAERLLIEVGREPWAAVAAYLGVRASPSAASADLAHLTELAERLDGHGWRSEAAEVRTIHGRLAIERGDLVEARRQLESASRAARGASVDVRAQAHLARALIALADGDDALAATAARRGVEVVDRRRASFGSSELRIATSAVGVPLVELGLRIALRSGRPASVLRWAERGRAAAMRGAASSMVPDDPVLADDLAELRALQLDRGAVGVDHRVAEIERRILRRRRLQPDAPARAGALSYPDLRARLAAGSLVEFVVSDQELHAVVVRARRSRLVHLGPVAAVRAESEHLLFALQRLSMLRAGAPRPERWLSSLAHASANLDEMLFAPLRLPSGGGLVVVPTGDLHRVPWSALATVRSRDTDVTPSATRWVQGAPAPRRRAPVALIAGPGLASSQAELDQLARLHRSPTVLSGADATVERALGALERADLAHIAAHGRLRADSPMYSALQLADGSLSVHDLERLRSLPRVVVLTACDAGRSAVFAGDELMGTAAALLGMGVGTVIAPVLPVADGAAAAFAVALHQRLTRGVPPAAALAGVVSDAHRAGDAAALAIAASFQCIGTCDSHQPIGPLPGRKR